MIYSGAAVAVVSVVAAQAQQATAHVNVVRDGHATQVRGTVKGYDEQRYYVAAHRGDRIHVVLKAVNGSTNLNLYPPGVEPGAGEAIFNGAAMGREATVTASATGDFLVQVYLMRNAARRQAVSPFALTVDVRPDHGR